MLVGAEPDVLASSLHRVHPNSSPCTRGSGRAAFWLPVRGGTRSLIAERLRSHRVYTTVISLHSQILNQHRLDIPFPCAGRMKLSASTARDGIPSLEGLRFGIKLAISPLSLSPYFIPKFEPHLLSLFRHFPFSIPLQAPFLTTQE